MDWTPTKRAKIYEALSAIADGRVANSLGNVANVISSDKSKSYIVEWSDDFAQVMSNDNASFYQGYMGYPIVAVILFSGKVTFDRDILKFFSDVPWKKLNTKHKNNYDKAAAEFLNSARSAGANVQKIELEIDRLYEIFKSLRIGKLGKRKLPPTEKAK